MALGSCSTAASCSRLVDENGPASSTGGRGQASTWQLQLSHWAVRSSYDAAQPTTSVDPAWGLFLPGRPHRVLGTPKNGRAAVRRAPGTPAVAWVPRTTYATAYQALTPQEALGRRSSNGRQGAGQPVRPPGTEHPPRAILAAHEAKHLDHLVSRSSYRVKLLLQLPKRVPAPSFSTGLALSSVDSQRRQGTQGTR